MKEPTKFNDEKRRRAVAEAIEKAKSGKLQPETNGSREDIESSAERVRLVFQRAAADYQHNLQGATNVGTERETAVRKNLLGFLRSQASNIRPYAARIAIAAAIALLSVGSIIYFRLKDESINIQPLAVVKPQNLPQNLSIKPQQNAAKGSRGYEAEDSVGADKTGLKRAGFTASRFDDLLKVAIPFKKAAHVGNGKLVVELLDAEDGVIASTTLTAKDRSKTAWLANLILPSDLKSEDLVWYRLRFRSISKDGATASEERIQSLDEIFRYPVVRLLGQQDLIAGSANALRVIAVDGKTGAPLKVGSIKLDLRAHNRQLETLRADLDNLGTAELRLTAPPKSAGEAELKLSVTTPLGSQQIVEKVNVLQRKSILLTTDKPVYQPGHLIHIRSLALDRFSRQAAAGEPIVFEIEDAKGNKVFRNRTATDPFGVASVEFQLAEEVNMGAFKVRAILGDPKIAQTNKQEKSFVVDRYVLPKFKIEIDTSFGKGKSQQKKYYMPGEIVTGRITAKYFFGKPISGARVKIKMISSIKSLDQNNEISDEILDQADSISDQSGQCDFSMKLPDSFESLDYGAASVAVIVTATDGANHTEQRIESLLVTNNPILITAIPESGEIVPGLTNRVYLLTAYPDGPPARTRISGNIRPASITTDSNGIAVIEVDGNSDAPLELRAEDASGRMGAATIEFKRRDDDAEANLMLRTDRSLYKVGERLKITAVSTKARGAVYIDVIKDRQTVLTRAVDLKKGIAKAALDLTADLFGALEVRAYTFDSDANPISDRRIIFVDPADDLLIDAAVAKESFRPGETAQINIKVKDRFGNPKSAVLDVQVVDEAVFALSERLPGFEKVFFHLGEQLLKPRYEINSIEQKDILLADGKESFQRNVRRQRAAQVLLAAANESDAYSLRKELGNNLFEKSGVYYEKYERLTEAKRQRFLQGMYKYFASGNKASGDLHRDIAEAIRASYVAKQDTFDPWGNAIDYIQIQNGDLSDPILIGSSLQTEAADLIGVVKDESGAVIAGAALTIKHKDTGLERVATTDKSGVYKIRAIPPGIYQLFAESAGFSMVFAENVVLPIDQSIRIDVTFLVPSGSEQVVVTAASDSANDEQRIDNLPINRRSSFNFSVTQAPTISGATSGLSYNGQAYRSNNLSIDYSTVNGHIKFDQNHGVDNIGVRSYFPETLFVNPSLITDRQGRATLHIPLADSITNWRLTMLASTTMGELGSSTSGIRVFQDFFIDLDTPLSLTQNDVLSVPTAVYNYLPNTQEVELTLQTDDWFTLVDDQPVKRITVAAGNVSAVNFRIRADRFGKQRLTVRARLMGQNSSANGDGVSRQIEVLPDGEQQTSAVNDVLEGSATNEILIPEDAIADTGKILVKFYPNSISQVAEGLDNILRLPSGCFEQTSSTTYPNVLAMDYMKTTRKLTPEIRAKAERLISLGYQRLVTFEVEGGGFSLFGQSPADMVLTAYGLMEFSDMSKVHEVDSRLIERTQEWLASQQQPHGNWLAMQKRGSGLDNEKQAILPTAYIGWALAYSGYSGKAVEQAWKYIDKNLSGKEDAYTLAVIANFAIDSKQDQAGINRILGLLMKSIKESDKTAFWSIKGQTPFRAYGDMAEIETTALAAQTLIKSRRSPDAAKKALQYLIEKKDPYGTWHSTQATILALKALLLSQQSAGAVEPEGVISVAVNGRSVQDIVITGDNNDLMHQLDLKQFTKAGRNFVELRYAGKGKITYQISSSYYRSWDSKNAAAEPFAIDVKYDRTRLEQDDIATATATVRNNMEKDANMVMVELGIPPGFEALSEDFQSLVGENENDDLGNTTKFTLAANKAVLYLDGLRPAQTAIFKYRLRAKYAANSKTFASRVFEYYNPKVSATAQPIEISIAEKQTTKNTK